MEQNSRLIEVDYTEVIKPKRDSNIELFRIITMLFIIAHHYLLGSGLWSVVNSSPNMSGASIFLILFGAWGKTGINCFVFITGYFMCKSKITVRKFLKLYLTAKFYNITFYFIFLAAGYHSFTLYGFLRALFPINGVATGNDFVSCYLLFYLFIPFINILIKNISECQHICLIFLLSYIYIFIGSVPKIKVAMNYVSWFITIYIIAAYVRLYPKKVFYSTRLWGCLALVSIAISSISIIVCAWAGKVIDNSNITFYFVIDSNKIFAVTTAFCAFVFFKNLKLKYNKVINIMAASTFGVLLIHTSNTSIARWLWRDVLNCVSIYDSPLLPIHAILSVIGVFVVCSAIDYLRIKFLEKPFFKWYDRREGSLGDHILKIQKCILRKLGRFPEDGEIVKK